MTPAPAAPNTISFNVGPSQPELALRQYLLDAYDSGILSLGHRSPAFSDIYRQVEVGFRSKLDLPASYRLYFLTSATECWSVLADGLIPEGGRSVHLTSGSFGQRWAYITKQIHPATQELDFGVDDDPAMHLAALANADLIALTHNETSNGTQLPDGFIGTVRQTYPDALIAVDATSSMAGVALPWIHADIWFASVQKCFGLPAGLAAMLVNERAVQRIEQLGYAGRYHALTAIHNNALTYQTVCTPNVLDIYLMARVLEARPAMPDVDAETRRRAWDWYQLVGALPGWSPLVQNRVTRSNTVIAVQGDTAQVPLVRKGAEAAGFVLGSGYGIWKPNTYRIANFPAIPAAAIAGLKDFLRSR